jgi:predicted O-methyltransferase YrrM
MIPDIEQTDYRPDLIGWSQDILPYYRSVAPTLPKGAIVVEVGVAHGRSLVFLAEELLKLGRDDVTLWGIDWWSGSWWDDSIAKTLAREDLQHVTSRFRLIREAEHRAVRSFEDLSVDLVFIDSDHSETGVNESIDIWVPKMKRGGILSGHDYDEQAWPGTVAAVRKWEVLLGPVERPTRTVWQWRVK